MGNEESQQQQAGPGAPPPQQQQQQQRGPTPSSMFGGMGVGVRQMAPPAMRPGGPGGGPGGGGGGGGGPVSQYPGGPGTVPRQPIRPGSIQVGVQPWADPPVQQPPRMRAPAPQQQHPVPPAAQTAPLRPTPQQQQQLKQQQQQQLQQQQQQAAMMMEGELGVDLSNLSEEEKSKILSVMARAQDLDEDYERHKRAKEEAVEQRPQLLCPLCQVVDLATEVNKMCGDCGKNFCQKCGTFVPGEGRRSVWVCNTCSVRRKEESAVMGHQDSTTYSTAGQKAGEAPRRDGTMSMSRMGQPFQQPQVQPQQQLHPQQQVQQQQQQQQQQQAAQQIQQQSVSLLGSTSSGSSSAFVTGSLIPNSVVGRTGTSAGSIPRTVPLSALSQTLQQGQQALQPQPQQQATQWNLQQAQQQQPVQGQVSLQMSTQKMKSTRPMDLAPGAMAQQQQKQQGQQQKGQKVVGEASDWSPATDLSPIMDVSPSLEAAEQELMEKCQEDQLRPIPRATSGTISGMLADFNKALGLATTPVDEGRAPGTPVVSAETDQNQNLVQQQFQLQQQQLMIQQQQQVIQQQQQQLQQQLQQQTLLQQQQQDLQQQQQQQQQLQQQATVTSLVQQQPGVVVSAPMQQQPQSQRKVHRRLPQPTMEQMQAAVAIAAQTSRSKSQTPRSSSIGVPMTSYQRPVSPMMAPGSRPSTTQTTPSILFDSSSSVSSMATTGQLQTTFGGVGSLSATPSLTGVISPTPRKDQEIVVTETESGKKIRRRLPPVPLDQEPTSVPTRRIKDRTRTLSMGATPLTSDRPWDKRIPQRTTSLDDGMSLTTALATTTTTSSILDYIGLGTTSTADSYLQYLSGGLLASSTSSALLPGSTTLGLSSTSMLGRRDLSAPHSLSSYLRTAGGVGVASSTSASYLLDHPVSETGPKLPSYILSLKQQLREELRSATEQRRRITDPDLTGLLSHSTWPGSALPLPDTTFDPLRKLGSSTLPLTSGGRVTAAQTTPKRSRHRRHASDTKLSMFTSLGRDELLDDPLSRYKLYQPTSSLPFKSFEFESIDDHLSRSDGLYGSSPYRALFRGATYPGRSSLTDMRLRGDEFDRMQLRDTTVNSFGGTKSNDPVMRRYQRELARLRRHTDTGLVSLGLGLDPYGRTPGYGVGPRHLRRPRSWHPSPYVSEDEDEREEKKAKIKAEIARRRQHIEENARLHDELYKVARLRDATGYVSPAYGDRLYSSPISLESGSSPRSQDSRDPDVLPAMDDLLLLRKDATYRNHPPAGLYTSYVSPQANAHRTARYDPLGRSQPWQYDPYLEDDRAVRGYVDDLEGYDPLYDYSPMATDSETDLAPMPLLPDMPTRSRKLLQDLGSSPIVARQHRHARSSGPPYDEYDDVRGTGDDLRGRQAPPPPHTSDRRQQSRKAQNSKASQKYDFPVKRILLTRDPKDRSVSGNGLGMKVVGGKEIPGSNGMIGAYVARIYPGGVVETLGEVREGDQVLEWNGVPLTGKTYEEVQRIIASSGDEVEIVIRSDFNMLSSRSSSHSHHHHHQQQQQNHHQSRRGGREHSRTSNSYHQTSSGSGYRSSRGDADGYNRNYDSADFLRSPVEESVHNSNYRDSYRNADRYEAMSPTRDYHRSSPTRPQRIDSPTAKCDTSDNKEKYRAEDISGEIQLQVCFDSKAAILYVTIVRARNLVTSRDNSGLPDPFVKCYLLPDRCVENQRRTRYFSRCSNPEWKQTMVYPNVPQDQLKKKHLEISVWNYDINRPAEFLGEVILDLKDTSVIDEQSRWYKLHPHDPKKYPSQSSTLNNEGAIKMARLNNPNQKSLYFENGGDDIRKTNNLERKFFKQMTKKSNVNDSYTRVSSQSWRLPVLHSGNLTAHPLLPQGCHGAVCSIL